MTIKQTCDHIARSRDRDVSVCPFRAMPRVKQETFTHAAVGHLYAGNEATRTRAQCLYLYAAA